MAGPLLLGIPVYAWVTGAGVSIFGWQYYKPGGGRDQILDSYGKNHAVAMNERADEEREKALATKDNTQVCTTCEPPPECKEINEKIKERRDELAKRYQEMREDKEDLYNLRPTGEMSWSGHIDQFIDKQKNLRKQLKFSEEKRCLPSEDAWKWASKEPPSQPSPK